MERHPQKTPKRGPKQRNNNETTQTKTRILPIRNRKNEDRQHKQNRRIHPRNRHPLQKMRYLEILTQEIPISIRHAHIFAQKNLQGKFRLVPEKYPVIIIVSVFFPPLVEQQQPIFSK